MVSPTSFMKGLGVGGHLVPFFKCVCLYFAAGGGAPSVTAAAAKCAPVIALAVAVLLHQGDTEEQRSYSRRIAVGLILSAMGDVALVWQQYFIWGMASFALAHIAYILALGWTPILPMLGLACYAATASCVSFLQPPSSLKILVPVYSGILATMAWRSLARVKDKRSRGEVCGAVGAILFLISDGVLGLSMFNPNVKYNQVLVMSTYYFGQLGIALSAIDHKPSQVVMQSVQ